MHADEEIAPAIQSILNSAATRSTSHDRATVTPRSLPHALQTATENDRIPVIAEYKPTSPTTDTETTIDPVPAAKAMVNGGAAAISILTEPEHFGGSPDHLRQIRSAVSVPVLRKDFILEEAHLDLVAADIILLIARFIDDLDPLISAAQDRGFQVLVEVHTPSELQDALDAGATIIGINNRDLTQLTVDLDTFEHVAPAAPTDLTVIAESGITTPAAAKRMRTAGADALLIGTAITHGPDSITTNTERFTNA